MPATTKLQAVNTMLKTVGESPVDNLDQPYVASVGLAIEGLDEVNRDVQSSRDWWFNSEKGVVLSPDGSGHINLGAETISVDVDPHTRSDIDPVQRGLKLYDRKNNTFVFTEDVKVERRVLLAFDDLPEQARRYITLAASRQFQERIQGSDSHYRFNTNSELLAYAQLRAEDCRNADRNAMRVNSIGWTVRR